LFRHNKVRLGLLMIPGRGQTLWR